MKVPWVLEGEPWSFVFIVPIIGVILIASLPIVFVVYGIGRLLGFKNIFDFR
jgi:hypothetical protein